jgi:glucose 1-dehydrogenase
VGICGTDREIARGGRATSPSGEKELIIGHEMLGRVEEVGSNVTSFKKGDLAVVTVRRGCGRCGSCLNDRADICYFGGYAERGIKGLHGFQTEYVVDEEKFLVKVPSSLRSCGVLCEPMSVVEKAIEECLCIQKNRLADWSGEQIDQKQALVVGLGPIGLLACMALKLRGFKVYGQDIVSCDSKKAKIVEEIGGTYIDGSNLKYQDLSTRLGQIDLLIEAVGIAKLSFDLLEALGENGAAVFIGIPEPHTSFTVSGGYLMHHLVMKNQLLLGSVNAAKKHWESAICDLQRIHEKWEKALTALISSRLPYPSFLEAVCEDPKDEIKMVLVWA